MHTSIIERLHSLFSTLGGWVLAYVLAIFSYLGDLKMAFGTVFLAIFVDMFWGIIASLRRGDFILSYLLRETFYKFTIYGSSLFLVMVIERSMYDSWNFATKTACAIAAACELWSIFANILIVRPKTPFIRLLRHHLIGEIEKKLNLNNNIFSESENSDDKEESD